MSVMKAIKELALDTIDELFRSATRAAKEEADNLGLPRYGRHEGKLLLPKEDETKPQGRHVA